MLKEGRQTKSSYVSRQEGGGDGEERLLGPRHEPVDDGIVDKARKVAAPGPERVADGRHGEHDVQIVGALGDEVLPDALLGRTGAVAHGLVAHLAEDGLLLLVGEEGGHHARGEHVVDELEEALLGHVLVAEEEDELLVLDAELVVEYLEVVAERGLVVAARQLDLEYVAAGGKGGQSRQALLAAAAHAHEQRVALVNANDAVDACRVLNGVVE